MKISFLKDPALWVPVLAVGFIIGLIMGYALGGAGNDRENTTALVPTSTILPTTTTTLRAIPAARLDISSPSSGQTTVQVASTKFIGNTEPGAVVEIGDSLVTADASGNFDLAVNLSEGTQTILVSASADGFKSASSNFTLVYELPVIEVEITAPVMGQEIAFTEVNVRGVTEPGAEVIAWGVSATAASDGTFSLMVPTPEGNHSLTANATKVGWAAGHGTVEFRRTKPTDTHSDGVYLVGTDMKPGRYKGETSGGISYWQISSDPNGSNIISNALPNGAFYVQVRSGQYLELIGVTITLVK